jgi:HemY protein
MLLSLLKILFFFAVVLAISLGAMQLSETGQMLRLEYGGTEIVLTPVKAVVALAVLMVAAWVVFKLLGLGLALIRFIAGDETAISRYFDRSRERKGYAALGEGMLAVASGEGKLAQDKAAKAAKYLDQPHLTNLLSAQAAETIGDRGRAERLYRQMLEDDRTRFVGIRGIMQHKLDAGDTQTALALAQKAYALKPKHKELQDTLLQLQTREHDWKGARAVLKDKRKQGDLPQAVHIRRDAVLALQEASEVLAHGSSISAREAAISANKASPDLIPAAVLAARSYIAQKDSRNAARVLEKTWSVRPHPDVAAAYAEIAPDETPAARLKRFERLISKNPNSEEAHLLNAELLLAAEDFPAARRALGDLAESHPTVRTLSIMAAIERGEGADDSVVRGWLAKALTASRGPQWVCDKCHNVMADWAPTCDSCGGFDTLSWREPEVKRPAATASTGAEMLPLLVGTPKPAAAAATESPAMSEPDPEPAATVVEPSIPAATPVQSIKPVEPVPATPEPAATAIYQEAPKADYVVATAPTDEKQAEPVTTLRGTDPSRPSGRPVTLRAAPAKPVEPQLIEPELVRPDVEPPEDKDWTPVDVARKV